MEIHVKMNEAEMNDFLAYRREKAGRTAARNRLQELAKKVLWAIGPNAKCNGFIIVDQDHAEDLMEMAAMYAE